MDIHIIPRKCACRDCQFNGEVFVFEEEIRERIQINSGFSIIYVSINPPIRDPEHLRWILVIPAPWMYRNFGLVYVDGNEKQDTNVSYQFRECLDMNRETFGMNDT